MINRVKLGSCPPLLLPVFEIECLKTSIPIILRSVAIRRVSHGDMVESSSNSSWREASALIIVSPSPNRQNLENITTQESHQTTQDESHTSCSGDHFDYRILMEERNESSSFLETGYVFPGGVVEASDFSPRWWQVFGQFGFDGCKLSHQINDSICGPRPQALVEPLIVKSMKESGQWTEYHLSPPIAFRIAAIRGTFEETGRVIHSEA